MSFICIVCRDLITPAGEGNNADLVVTKCGHLYHLNCLEGWFNSRDYPRLECPYCKARVIQADLQRVFPSGDEETDEIINRYQDAKAQHGVNRQLQEEIDEKLGQLVEFQAKYEDERLVHDLMRCEYTKFVTETKGKVKAKLQEIRKEAEQERQALLEEAEAVKLQLTNELEKKDQENLSLKQQLEEQSDRINTLKDQEVTLRNLLMAEKANKNVSVASNGQKQDITVGLCIQLLQNLKPNATGSNSAALQMLGEELLNASAAVVIKEENEEMEMEDRVEIKVEDDTLDSVEVEVGDITEPDSHDTSSSDDGVDRASEGPGGTRTNTDSSTPDTSSNKSIMDESCDDSTDPNIAHSTMAPVPRQNMTEAPSFLDMQHSTGRHLELDITRSDMADMTLVAKAN